MNTYKVQLSQYATVAYRTEVTIDAKSEEEAVIKAEKMVEKEPDKYFDEEWECVDGWEIQSESVEEISHGV